MLKATSVAAGDVNEGFPGNFHPLEQCAEEFGGNDQNS